MTYSVGNTIVASDYNGFANDSANNINKIWGAGTANVGYGQSTTLSNVAVAATVTATQWSSLNSRITSIASHQGSTITSRTNPVAGNTIAILANLSTDINAITLSSGNAATQGTQNTAWTGNSTQLANIVSANTFVITFTHTVGWANTNASRYFFNGGGTIKWQCSKTSTGQPADAEWNSLAGTECGSIYISSGGYSQQIAGNAYTGTTKSGGTGTPTTLTTTTGFNQYTTTPIAIYKQYSNVYGYTQNYIQVTANVNSNTSPTALTLVTTWNGAIANSFHPSANITGGTNTTGISFGTGPATVVTYFPPESTYLTVQAWGTPTVAATVANTTTAQYAATYLAVGGGGAGGSSYTPYAGGGGGAGGFLTGTLTFSVGTVYTATVGAGGSASQNNPGAPGTWSNIIPTNSSVQLVRSQGGGGGGGGNGGAATGASNGGDGGSGGGGGGTAGLGGLAASGQGNNGGIGNGINLQGGGGGGANAAGGGAAIDSSGAGGAGTASSITGSSVTYAGGGGGSQSGAGGAGGGTTGVNNGTATAGTANLGGGGGGGSHGGTTPDGTNGKGGNGGAGVIIFSVPTANYTGTVTGTPTVTTSGSNTIIKFTTTGTYTA